ncbi:MAG: SDR family oxidoreductase [Rhodospirillaceae bacterium]|jgi:NAD(P)-dependent dehydrogenase (short-subunit alcohol dehydrogenase family)|nr:SDR family oxidoreductase [Rhodospirillaceae bacterium]MBT5413028.1 SDR family oxidoreductase [Rhodospirillaceae bacterium]MBT6116747.1 SDR family oxidoreductase [Rhodospirillaceae bacterium]
MSDKRVAVIAACGKGLGEAIARALHAHGHSLVMMGRSEGVEDLAKELDGIAVRGDVGETADLQSLIDTAMKAHGRIDAVMNNTGHVRGGNTAATAPVYDPETGGDLLEVSDEDWMGGLNYILLNVVRMARIVTPIMEKQGSGAILNMSSFAHREPAPAFPVGACLRMALGGFTKMYADKYARAGIRMNCILPGFIENYPMSDEIRRRVPLGRSGKLEEVGETANFLLTDAAGYITGQSILVDGGMNRGV